MPAEATSQHAAQHAHQTQDREGHQPLDRFGGETRALDLRQNDRRAQQHRGGGGEPAANGTEPQRGCEDGHQIRVTEE